MWKEPLITVPSWTLNATYDILCTKIIKGLQFTHTHKIKININFQSIIAVFDNYTNNWLNFNGSCYVEFNVFFSFLFHSADWLIPWITFSS